MSEEQQEQQQAEQPAGAEAPPQAAAPEAEQVAAGDTQQQQADEAAPPVDDVRAQIAERLRAKRAAQLAENPEASQSVMNGDLATPIVEKPAAGAEPLALNGDRVKLTVEGKELEVDATEVLEAGKRALQKDHSADLKLRRASAAEQLAAQRLAEAERIRQEALALKDSGRLPSSGAGQNDASHLPTGAGERSDDALRAGMSQAQDALFEGDTEKAAQVISETARLEVIRETNTMFAQEFGDVASNPEVFRRAVAAMRAELPKASLAQIPAIATRIGLQLREQMLREQIPDPVPAQPATPAVEQRSQVKARLPVMPARASARSPSSLPAAQTPQTRSQIVHQMRVARGQIPKGA